MVDEKKSDGIWIPEDLLQSKKFTLIEKHFIVAITNFDNEKGCFASNQHFSERFQLTKMRCSQVIRSLRDKNMITMRLEKIGVKSTRRTLNIINQKLKKSLRDRDGKHKGLKEVLESLSLEENVTAKGLRGRKPIKKTLLPSKEDFIDKSKEDFITSKEDFITSKDNFNYINISNNKDSNEVSKDTIRSKQITSKENIPKNGLLGNINEYELPKKYKSPLTIIRAMEKDGLSIRLPSPGKRPSKTLIKAMDYLISIKSGSFVRKSDWDRVWTKKNIKKWTNKDGYDSWKTVNDLVITSLEKMKREQVSNDQVGGRLNFPTTPEKFLFSIPHNSEERVGKSMFLKYMNVDVKTTADFITAFQKSGISEENRDRIDEVLKEKDRSWNAIQRQCFWAGMRKLVTWYNSNVEWVRTKAAKREGSMFNMRMSSVNSFFRFVVVPYLRSIDKMYFPYDPIPTDRMQNSRWREFCLWLYEKDQIKLDDWGLYE